jgi:glycosylphosphatidylinositol transamidase (GPIT) subunit GPI8
VDHKLGLSVIDRFTYHTLEFMQRVDVHSATTADQLFDTLVHHKVGA